MILNCIRRFWKHILFGATIGVVSFELWLYALPAGVPQWLLCAVAVAFVLGTEYAVAELRDRRARRALPRRRAHARPTTTRKDTTSA
jgi:hypothetical protein